MATFSSSTLRPSSLSSVQFIHISGLIVLQLVNQLQTIAQISTSKAHLCSLCLEMWDKRFPGSSVLDTKGLQKQSQNQRNCLPSPYNAVGQRVALLPGTWGLVAQDQCVAMAHSSSSWTYLGIAELAKGSQLCPSLEPRYDLGQLAQRMNVKSMCSFRRKERDQVETWKGRKEGRLTLSLYLGFLNQS